MSRVSGNGNGFWRGAFFLISWLFPYFLAGWLPNFERLVLGCMDSYDSEKRRILQRFSRSTRFTYLRTAQISKIQLKIVKLFAKLNIEYSIFCIFSLNFHIFKLNFDEILSEFRQNFQKMMKFIESLIDSIQNYRNFSENAANFWKIMKILNFAIE